MKQLQGRLVKRLQSKMMSPKSEHQQQLYAIYLTSFVLLYNLEFLYRDQMLKIVRNPLKSPFSRLLTISSEHSKPTLRALPL